MNRQTRGSLGSGWRGIAAIGLAVGIVGAAVAMGVARADPAANTARPADKPVSGPPAGYAAKLTFDEPFDGTRLDSTRWQTSYGAPEDRSPGLGKRSLWNNGERQAYFDPSFLGLGIDPFRIADGVLTIEARPLPRRARELIAAELRNLPRDQRESALADLAYSSGLISSRGHFAQKLGYFEMRARWSDGKGLWPAFWLLPEGGGWPPEIDVVEAHGDKPNKTFHSLHLSGNRHTTKPTTVATRQGGFHTYGALWLPDRIDYYVDAAKVATIALPEPLEEPMYMIANLAIGGNWPGDPDGNTQFPARLEIDHIRAWSIEPRQ